MEDRMNPQLVKIWNAVCERRRGLGYFAVTTAVALAILAVLGLLCLPKTAFYTQDIQLFLNRTPDGFQYPNGRPFSAFDITSKQVLHRVYDRCDLKDILPFDDFAELFSVVAVTPKKEFLDAAYAKKLARRNITGVEIAKLESQYAAELAALDQGRYAVVMRRDGAVSPKLAVRIVGDIALVWKEIFQRQEGKNLPQGTLSTNLKERLETEFQNGPLIAVDRANYYVDQMERLCTNLAALHGSRNVVLPDTGESLKDITERLQYIRSYQLAVLTQMILQDSSLRGVQDLLFVTSKTLQLEQELTRVRSEQKSTGESLDQVMDRAGVGFGENSNKNLSEEMNQEGFYAQLAALIRNDALNPIRAELAKQFRLLGVQAAQLEEQLSYYNYLKSRMSPGKATEKTDPQLFGKLYRAMLGEMIQTSRKLEEFRTMIVDNTILEQEFCVPVGPAYLKTERVLSPAVLLAGAAGLWLLLNFCAAAVAGSAAFRKEA